MSYFRGELRGGLRDTVGMDVEKSKSIDCGLRGGPSTAGLVAALFMSHDSQGRICVLVNVQTNSGPGFTRTFRLADDGNGVVEA